MGRGSGKIHPSFIIVSQEFLEDVVIMFVSCIQVSVLCHLCHGFYVMFQGSMFDITFEPRSYELI